ncbi:CueP family metal-binding protein [Ornithinimicrobium cerasi]|uniref:CueP family metal-binding protein n=1 Tax=Ornithinimicrobium cerasi TaxID=2248773 RepID=A0A285VRQ2_9MICO|nr:CueP family metal-binding protein [Ornithinimicrobium cerasi]SOC56729.1 hypothetical protein SAMN05421879_108117 [Ornithinimicrobium cerasi]
MHRRPAALLAVAALAVGLSGCTTEEPTPAATASTQATPAADEQQLPDDLTSALAGFGVDAADMRSAITELDQVDQERPLDVQASVRAHEVVFTGASGEVSMPIEGEEMYVSIAPYVDQTHECYYHALGGCQGEMTGEDVHVTITAEDGTVLVDEDVTTYANGFVGFWLPRDVTGTVAVTAGDLTGETPFDTTDEGPTCITTLQLA